MAKLEPEVLKISGWDEPYGSASVRIYVKNSICVEFSFEKQLEDIPLLTELNIRSIGNARINTAVIQKLNLGELIEVSLDKLREVGLNSEDLDYAIEFISNKKNWLNSGNKPLPDINYACTAFVYYYLKTSGTKKILQELAKLSNVKSIDTIKKRVQETKTRGFISVKKIKSKNFTYMSKEILKIMTINMRKSKEK